jgi:hypothetical protein
MNPVETLFEVEEGGCTKHHYLTGKTEITKYYYLTRKADGREFEYIRFYEVNTDSVDDQIEADDGKSVSKDEEAEVKRAILQYEKERGIDPSNYL